MHDLSRHRPDAAGDAAAHATFAAGNGHFVIIGAQKSGTTSLYAMLAQHPQIAMSDRKETNFFAHRSDGDYSLEAYERCFSRAAKWRGEASPNYTMRHEYEEVPERMARAIPGAQLIFIVRDPVARAVSQYQHDYLSDRIPDTRFPGPLEERLRHCVETSSYYRQIMAFIQFYPRERLLILDFDELKARPLATAGLVCEFLNLPSVSLKEAHNSERNGAEDRGATPRFILQRWNAPWIEAIRDRKSVV